MTEARRPIRVVIAAGGTGGHLYPGIALARELKRHREDAELVFVGTPRGLEGRVLAHEGFPLVFLCARPVMGVGMLGAVRGLSALPRGVWQSARLLRNPRADLVIAVGGYTSPAVVLAATLLRIPRVLLEPNARAGMANTVLGPLATRVFVAFEAAAEGFPRGRVRVVGSPIREDFRACVSDSARGQEAERPLLLIFGGSQGARAINEAMIEALPHLAALRGRLRVVHQTGEADQARVRAAYSAAGFDASVVPFLYDLPRWLRQASLVLCRAGAMTVAELTACGKAAVLVPLPQAIHGHQLQNARVLERDGAAVLLPQAELTGARLAAVVGGLLSQPERLRQMDERSRRLGRVDSAETIVKECLAIVEGKNGKRAPNP